MSKISSGKTFCVLGSLEKSERARANVYVTSRLAVYTLVLSMTTAQIVLISEQQLQENKSRYTFVR